VIYAGGTIGMFKDNSAGYTTGDQNGYLQRVCESNPIFHSLSTTNNGCRAPVAALGSPLVMPPSIFGKTIIYQILEYSPLLDSSNMTVEDWIKIANDIQTYYHHFDGFVVLHGTDTMAYTASALSFMLENLGKSVILTGSQIPLSELRNDATSNFLGAMTIAGHYIIPEVTLFFCNKLFRGNRAVKSNLSSFDAFESANHKPLATVGINIGAQVNF
jgi:lysophospholipase